MSARARISGLCREISFYSHDLDHLLRMLDEYIATVDRYMIRPRLSKEMLHGFAVRIAALKNDIDRKCSGLVEKLQELVDALETIPEEEMSVRLIK